MSEKKRENLDIHRDENSEKENKKLTQTQENIEPGNSDASETTAKNVENHKKSYEKIQSKSLFQKICILVLILGAAVMIVAGGFFAWKKLLRPASIANYLPADTTIAFMEVDIDENSEQVQNFFQLFHRHPEYQKSTLIKQMHESTSMDYQKDMKPWLGRKLAVALVKDPSQKGSFSSLFFLEEKDDAAALKFLQNYALVIADIINLESPPPALEKAFLTKDYQGQKTYLLASGGACMLLNHYIVFAENEALLHNFIDAQKDKGKLRDDQNYRKIADNLPQGGLVFVYVNIPKAYETFFNNRDLASPTREFLRQAEPLLKMFSAQGMTVFAKKEQFQIQAFSTIDPSQVAAARDFVNTQKYQGNLLKLAGENPTLLISGHNFANEMERLINFFGQPESMPGFVWEDVINSLKGKYFGSEISLQEDIFPLLKNEYLLEIDQNLDTQNFTFILEVGAENQEKINQQRFEKVINAFATQSGVFEPQIREVILPDGTKGKELVAAQETVTKLEQNFQGIPVTSMKLGKLSWGVHYAFVGKNIVVSTSLENVQKVIARSGETEKFLTSNATTRSLRESTLFHQDFEPILGSADEVFHSKIGMLMALLSLDRDQELKRLLDPFVAFTMTNNFFDDGISSLFSIDIY